MNHFIITQSVLNQEISISTLEDIILNKKTIVLDNDTKKNIVNCCNFIEDNIIHSSKVVYGINTGFGSLCNTLISKKDLSTLQTNLVLSHACGIGEYVPNEIVRRMLLLKILGLSHGKSGVQLDTVERLIFFFNNNILPIVYQQGSLGASGDLAPLAHLSLPLIGEGEVHYQQKTVSTKELYQQLKLSPITLKPKEGLALLNGTQFMSAYAWYSITHSFKLLHQFNYIATMSLDAYNAHSQPFQENINVVRKQKGQIEVAQEIRELRRGSSIMDQKKDSVQDPYSFRCIPQVHGASLDTIRFCSDIVEREIKAVTDNPTIFPEENDVVSGGNFHGQPLALSMDFLAIALSELGSISERRTYKLLSGERGLPVFLSADAGLNSGFMIPHYTCASVVSQNKQLCMPASIDTIDSSNGQEDHVSMGANAATKLYRIIDNCYTIQGIELLNAAQAIDFRRPQQSSEKIERLHSRFRETVNFVSKDCYLHPLIAKSKEFVINYSIDTE